MSKALKRICLVITQPRLFFELKPHVTWRLIAFQADLPVMDWFRRPGSRPDIGISDRPYFAPALTFASNVIAPTLQPH
jgi:hypothetical protein